MNEIELMLSNVAQEYYGGLYVDFQKNVSKPDNKFFQDYEMICNVISEIKHSYNIVDIGSGSCRWFNLFENQVIKYFAIEVNKIALASAPQNSKLFPINENIYDEKFDLIQFVKTKIDIAFFGFFLSHFSDKSIHSLLGKLNTVNRLIIVDSFWGSMHKSKYFTKELRNIKRSFSTTEKVVVPKRFFDNSDIDNLVKPFGYSIKKFYAGKYWFICIAEK